MPFMRRLHAGLEVEVPFVSFLAGYSEGFISYGAEVRLWPVKIIAGFYSSEMGVELKEFESGNYRAAPRAKASGTLSLRCSARALLKAMSGL